ncbi:MAG: hypothetical protein M0Z42_04775 [Actinomycetota bacterium]|nr:hypothetical protein [Actinomycetota bacterium]
MTVVLDAGALVAVDRRDRGILTTLRLLERDGVPVRTSAGALAQVWRGGPRQANLARVVRGLDVAALDENESTRVGELLAAARTEDVVDAHVALLVEPGGTVLTSDGSDIALLLGARKVQATVVRV